MPSQALRSLAPDSSRRESEPPHLRARQPLSPFPELDCVRHLLPVGVIAEAGRRAREVGIGADRALISAGAISEYDYVAALARHLGVGFETLEHTPRWICPHDDDRLLAAPAAGLLPLKKDDGVIIAIAPRKHDARRLCMLRHAGDLPPRVCLTTCAGLQRFVDRHCADAIACRAATHLKTRHPQLSAAHHDWRLRCVVSLAAISVAAGAVAAPTAMHLTIAILFSLLFTAWTGLRILASTKADPASRLSAPHPHDLPDYTIIIALYREAAVIGRLVAALDALRYPREKLDIKFVVEPDDFETRAALGALTLDARYQIVIAPASGPRTKPKALNAALPFARGHFSAVYDAEDRPESDQLVAALACFRRGGEKLACVQGRLTIDNTADSYLTRLFTAEYCGLFDVLLPALAAWRLPLPLGGSSNHFRGIR